jgi:hypothetical protein
VFTGARLDRTSGITGLSTPGSSPIVSPEALNMYINFEQASYGSL